MASHPALRWYEVPGPPFANRLFKPMIDSVIERASQTWPCGTARSLYSSISLLSGERSASVRRIHALFLDPQGQVLRCAEGAFTPERADRSTPSFQRATRIAGAIDTARPDHDKC